MADKLAEITQITRLNRKLKIEPFNVSESDASRPLQDYAAFSYSSRGTSSSLPLILLVLASCVQNMALSRVAQSEQQSGGSLEVFVAHTEFLPTLPVEDEEPPRVRLPFGPSRHY